MRKIPVFNPMKTNIELYRNMDDGLVFYLRTAEPSLMYIEKEDRIDNTVSVMAMEEAREVVLDGRSLYDIAMHKHAAAYAIFNQLQMTFAAAGLVTKYDVQEVIATQLDEREDALARDDYALQGDDDDPEDDDEEEDDYLDEVAVVPAQQNISLIPGKSTI